MFKDFMEQCLGIHNKKLQKELSDVAKLRTFFKGENLIRVEDKTKEGFSADGRDRQRVFFSGMTAGTLRTASVFGQERRLLAEAGRTCRQN